MPTKPLTKKELKEYFQVYRDAFPDWQADAPYSVKRTCGPITQVIGFQSLSYGAYRPMCGVEILGPPGGGSSLLAQMLDVKHREVNRREHAEKWPKVLHAMEEQFVPDIRKPLDVAEVLKLAEEHAERSGITNERYLVGLATLNVHLGRNDRAIAWCNRAEESLKQFAESTPPSEGMTKDMNYACQLREAIQSGRAMDFLEVTPKQIF